MINFSDENLAKGKMTQERLHEIVLDYCGTGKAVENILQTSYEEAPLIVISDATHDRMRIMSPIVDAGTLSEPEKTRLLEANFHTALDARYAIGNEVLYSAFIHPLSPLTSALIESGIRQVATLRNTFGTTYNSGELNFPG